MRKFRVYFSAENSGFGECGNFVAKISCAEITCAEFWGAEILSAENSARQKNRGIEKIVRICGCEVRNKMPFKLLAHFVWHV